MSDIYVYQVPLPRGINEMVTPSLDDSYTVYIDERLSDEKKLEAYQHALEHIKKNDWSKEDVQEIESIAHGAPDPSPEKSSLIAELLKRHQNQKAKAARKRKLDRIAKKYSGMSTAEIYEHNEKMIAKHDQ